MAELLAAWHLALLEAGYNHALLAHPANQIASCPKLDQSCGYNNPREK